MGTSSTAASGGKIPVALASIALAACSGVAGRNDDLGYDPSIPFEDEAVAAPLFEAGDAPVGSAGVPLRGAAVMGEWTGIRGNAERTGTRLAPGIDTPQIAWQARVGIQGYANTPLVADDTVFVGSQGTTHNVGDAEDGFYALDVESGAQRWFTPTNEDINGVALTPELVLGGTDDGTLYAVERASGDIRWEVELDEAIHHGPLIDGERALIQTSRGVQVVALSSGQVVEMWRGSDDDYAPRGGLASSGALVLRSARSCQLDAWSDGDPRWSASVCMPPTEEWMMAATYAPPSFVGGAALAIGPSRLDYEGAAVSVSLRHAQTGSELWRTEVERSLRDDDPDGQTGYDQRYLASSPWVMSGIVYAPRLSYGSLVGLDLATGEPVRFVDLPGCRARQFASIVGTPTRGYYARHDGIVYAFAPSTGELAWAVSLQYAASAAPVGTSHGASGFLPDDGYCYADPWDGTALFSTPAIGEDGTLYVGTGEGYLFSVIDAGW